MKLLRKPELSINICRESLIYVINVAFGYEIYNPENVWRDKIHDVGHT